MISNLSYLQKHEEFVFMYLTYFLKVG